MYWLHHGFLVERRLESRHGYLVRHGCDFGRHDFGAARHFEILGWSFLPERLRQTRAQRHRFWLFPRQPYRRSVPVRTAFSTLW